MRIFKSIKKWKTVANVTVFISLAAVSCKKDEPEPAAPTPTNAVASWTCTEVSKRDGTAQPFTVHIVKSAGTGDTLLIENFYALGFDKKAKMIQRPDDSVFILPLPQAVTPGVIVKSGYGKFSNTSSLTMHYVIDDGQPVKDTVNATFSKQ